MTIFEKSWTLPDHGESSRLVLREPHFDRQLHGAALIDEREVTRHQLTPRLLQDIKVTQLAHASVKGVGGRKVGGLVLLRLPVFDAELAFRCDKEALVARQSRGRQVQRQEQRKRIAIAALPLDPSGLQPEPISIHRERRREDVLSLRHVGYICESPGQNLPSAAR